jgi:hypothetical protein
MSWKHVLGAGAGAAALAVGPVAGPVLAADGGQATVTVVHGVPGVEVDVYANDDKILSGFAFKEVSDALRVPGGTYDLEVRKAGDPASAEPILSATERVPAGANVTVVAALDSSGDPVLKPYVNDTGAVAAGSGRLVVRHSAAAPEVDVYAGADRVISSLANGAEKALTVPSGQVPAKVTLAGKDEAVLGPADVDVAAGMATVVLAVGSAEDGNLALVTQSYALGGTPSSAQAGSGGQAGTGAAAPLWPALGAAGLVLAAAGGLALSRR